MKWQCSAGSGTQYFQSKLTPSKGPSVVKYKGVKPTSSSVRGAKPHTWIDFTAGERSCGRILTGADSGISSSQMYSLIPIYHSSTASPRQPRYQQSLSVSIQMSSRVYANMFKCHRKQNTEQNCTIKTTDHRQYHHAQINGQTMTTTTTSSYLCKNKHKLININ